jgi:hypothetical protein
MTDEEATIGETGKPDSTHPPTPGNSSRAIVDLEKLADKVSRLMRYELRLEMARGQQLARRRTR